LFKEVVKELRATGKMQLFWAQMQDLLILEEMEWNGLKYRIGEAAQRGTKTQEEIAEIDAKLRALAGHDCINFGSDDHLSCLLYGGTVWERYREKYTRTLKDGTEKERERWSFRPIEFAQLVKPIKNSETTATAGLDDATLSSRNSERSSKGLLPTQRIYSVAEPVLRRLKLRGKAKEIVDLLGKRAELSKLDGTYYTGLVTKHREAEWPDDTLHGRFNQCVAATGRLSSSDPNLQNFSRNIKDLFYTRYGC
jgi:DNA polymerase I-like protein with 3'-5' exonuclease and polymerase domains